MTFTTPCFVRVEDAAERKKLIEWLDYLGYSTRISWNPWIKFVYTEYNSAGGCSELTIGTLQKRSINCGTNVDLFKALAAMNDDNDREQWFVVDDGFEEEMGCAKSDVDYDYILSCSDYRKATAEEIVEYFKNK